jgi:hypothetical protein
MYTSLKTLIRPCTSLTRRKELIWKGAMPREAFEELMEPLQPADATGVQRDATSRLIPTSKTARVQKFEYTIRKGSVTDRLLHLHTLDTAPPPTKPAPEVAEIGEEGVYEVEDIRASRKKGTRTEYLIKWQGWAEASNTWESPSNIHPSLVRVFEGKPAPPSRVSAPELYKRGAGCAHRELLPRRWPQLERAWRARGADDPYEVIRK